MERSGCPPAWLSVELVENEVIVCVACAGPASDQHRRRRRERGRDRPQPHRDPLFLVFFGCVLAQRLPWRFLAAAVLALARLLGPLRARFVPLGAGQGVDVGRGRRFGPGAVALVRGFAGDRRRQAREAPLFAGVVDLDQLAVVVLGHENVAGEEVGVGAVGADAQERGVEAADPGRDQADRPVRPLVGVDLVVEVARRQGVGRVEEDPAVIGEAEPVRRHPRVARGAGVGRVAGGAGEFVSGGVVADDLGVAVVVVAGERDRSRERRVLAARRHLEVGGVAGAGIVDGVDDGRVVRARFRRQ